MFGALTALSLLLSDTREAITAECTCAGEAEVVDDWVRALANREGPRVGVSGMADFGVDRREI